MYVDGQLLNYRVGMSCVGYQSPGKFCFQMLIKLFIYILAVYFDRNSTLAFVAAMMICVQCYCLYNLPNLVSMRGMKLTP